MTILIHTWYLFILAHYCILHCSVLSHHYWLYSGSGCGLNDGCGLNGGCGQMSRFPFSKTWQLWPSNVNSSMALFHMPSNTLLESGSSALALSKSTDKFCRVLLHLVVTIYSAVLSFTIGVRATFFRWEAYSCSDIWLYHVNSGTQRLWVELQFSSVNALFKFTFFDHGM